MLILKIQAIHRVIIDGRALVFFTPPSPSLPKAFGPPARSYFAVPEGCTNFLINRLLRESKTRLVFQPPGASHQSSTYRQRWSDHSLSHGSA